MDLFYWLALSHIPGVGSVIFKRLLDHFKSPEAVFNASIRELLKIEGLGEKIANEIIKGPDKNRVEKDLKIIKDLGIKLITINDDMYPKRLKEIYDPPPLLYIRGELKREDDLAVAIVGSRKTNPYGRWITEKLSSELARSGVTIVSGMARGIDSQAHQGAISGGGRTIAVLGCGVDIIYPSENRNLFYQIIENGAVISEFPIGSLPEGGHFPRRNRIISGLSLGVVVVQAGRESGSLITARFALEQGRDVFAVPGNVGLTGSSGTNRLIKEGAKLVESSEDILQEVLPQWRTESSPSKQEEIAEIELDEDERIVFSLLGDAPIHIDTIIRESQFDPGRVSSILLNLELKGFILQWPGKCFTRKIK